MTNEQIAQEILNHRKGENKHYAAHLAVGRVSVDIEDYSYKVFWLYNTELDKKLGNYKQQRYVADESSEKGVAKNSRMGEFLIRRKSGAYPIEKKEYKIKIKDFSTYQPVNIPKIDAISGTIEIKGKKKILFSSLFNLLEFLETEQAGIKPALEQLLKDQRDALELGKTLSEAEQEQLKKLSALTHYIRSNNEMRMQAILDPQQEEVKRLRIFNGLLVIDGGPGTGKTTTLIQRIKFLTDTTITEYGEQYAALLPQLQSKNGWIFFTPSTLLLGYLRNAMTSEGLSATDQTSKVWATYLNNELLKNYGLAGADKPFQIYRHKITPIFSNNPIVLQAALDKMEKYIVTQVADKIKKNAGIKLLFEEGKLLGMQIQANASGITDSKDLLRLIINADELQNRFRNDFEQLAREIRKTLQQHTDTILLRLKKDAENYAKTSKHLKDLFDKRQPAADEEEEDEDDIDTETVLVNIFNEDLENRKAIRNWLRKLALNKASSSEKVPDKLKSWVNLIARYTNELPLEELGKRLHFLKYTQPIILGSTILVFNKLPAIYKRFRKTLPDFFAGENLPEAAAGLKIVLASDIARLHYDERNFLLLFINNLIRKLHRTNASVFTNSDHIYINTYKEQQRFVIAIDEASDFSLVELACMHSFSHPSYNCTTLSGDLMQRMTDEGLKDWDSFVKFIGDGEVKNLTISYRQSPGLLKLAKDFYERVTGKTANYISYTDPSTFEPKPVIKKITSSEEKVKWIAKKIIAIYRAYGNKVPSIAIFVPDDESVALLTKQLKECDELPDNGIDVRGVTKEGATIDKSQVNVYNIESIKGLEFEAVFFVDVDKIRNTDKELLQKYIYVGISRSAYYLFVTYEKTLPDGLESLKDFEE